MLSRLRGRKPAAESVVRQKSAVEEIKEEKDVDDLVVMITEALSFEGFDSVRLRKTAVETLTFSQLITLLSAYVTTGNSLASRITSKRVADKEVADTVIATMRSTGVKTRPATGTDLTLPRLATCFPALVIYIRLHASLEPRVVTDTPKELQDICLNGWSDTVAATGCVDFIDKFALILGKAEVKPPAVFNPEACLERSRRFRELGRLNQAKDAVGQAAMAKKITKDTKAIDLAKIYGFTFA